MSIFRCYECDRTVDSDFEGCFEFDKKLVCPDCHERLTLEREEEEENENN